MELVSNSVFYVVSRHTYLRVLSIDECTGKLVSVVKVLSNLVYPESLSFYLSTLSKYRHTVLLGNRLTGKEYLLDLSDIVVMR